jgi:hypothetical protein
MAIINYTYTDDRPNIVYQITCNCTRSSNSQITYSGTVTWNLRYSDSHIGTGYVLECRATSSTGGDSGWIAFTEWGSSYSGTTKRSFSYSFTATSSSAGAFDRVTFSFRNNSNYDSGYNSFSTYTDFSTPALLWTNCTAPSRVWSPDALIIKPGTLLVNWSGATDGTDNAIKNYTVYWLVSPTSGELPTTSWYSGKETTSHSFYNITIPESYRGKYISVRIQSNATYNNPISSDYIRRSVNSLPNSPLISTTSKTIPSTQTSVTITDILPGNLNFGSKSGSVYWARTSDGPENPVNEGKITDNTLGDLTQGHSRDYYFWTHDGLEYSSSSTKVTITKNIKPEMLVTSNAEKTTYSKVSNQKDNTVLEIFSNFLSANKNCFYDVKIKRYVAPGSSSLLLTLIDNEKLTVEGIPLNRDIRSLGLPECEYYFEFTCRDEIEVGNSVTTDRYISPSLPTFSNDTTYNKFSESNVPGTNPTDFYQELRFVSSHYDSYLDEKGIFRLDTGSNESISYTVSKSLNQKETKIFYDITITSDLVPGQSYDFFPTLQLAGLTSSALVSRRRTPVLDPTPSSGSTLYIKPFTDGYNGNNLSQKISISKGSFVDAALDDNFYNYYNIDKENSKWWKSEIIISDNQKIDISTLVKGGNISGDYYERNFTIADSTFFDKIPSKVSKTGVLTCALKNTVTNRFGQTISKQSSIVTLDFNENPEIISLIREGNNSLYLYEGYKLRLTYTIKTFSYNKVIRYSCLINREDGKGFVSYGNKGDIQDNNPSPKFGIGRIFTDTIEVGIGEIQQSGECYFNMIFYDGDSTIYSTKKAISCQRIKFIPPTILFDKATYISEGNTLPGKVNCQYNIIDWGYDSSQEELFSSKSFILELNLSKYEETKNTTNTIFSLTERIIDFKIGRLTLTTTITYNSQSITKFSTSNDLIIYGINPTVAYRQNHLGINTSTLQDDSILTIAPTSGRNIIYFQKEGSTDFFKINLATGALEGFNIDCGEIK